MDEILPMCQNYAAVGKKEIVVKSAYSVAELSRMMGINRKSTARLLAKLQVPIHRSTKRGKGWIWLEDLRGMAPTVWDSMVTAASVRRYN